MGEHRFVKKLRGVAARLTCDLELQKDLSQEMIIHLTRVEADLPGRTPSWYLQSCQFHARNYLARGRSIDSVKRQKNLVPFAQGDELDHGDFRSGLSPDAVDPVELHDELIARDIIELIVERLTDIQQQILFLLMHDFGVREIAGELNTTHPTVIKHRKKIARIASCLHADYVSIGVTQPSPAALGECDGANTPR